MPDARPLPVVRPTATLPADGACCEACAAASPDPKRPDGVMTAAAPAPEGPRAPASGAGLASDAGPASGAGLASDAGPASGAGLASRAEPLPTPPPRATAGPAGPLVTLQPRGPMPAPLDRNGDRRITVGGLALAAGFLVLATAGVLVPTLRGQWLPLHLVLAGAATVAIGAVMPFFASALVNGEPAPAPARVAIIGLLAGGALAVGAGFGATNTNLAISGGLLFITGLIALLGLTVAILRGSIGAKRRVFTVIYGMAIVNVIVGASIATLFLGGERTIAANWAVLKPAHAWLNLFGFVSLVICSSLVHLFPTIVGARMDRSAWSIGAVIALAIAPPVIATGYVLRVDLVAQAGAILMAVGTVALLVVAARIWRSRGGWTGDRPWHTMAMGSLWAGLGWFTIGVAVAVERILVSGAQPDGWSVTALIAPLGVGFVIQIMVGAWTHLLPAIGPGTPALHAVARSRLGIAAWPRLVLLNAGAAALFAGSVAENGDVTKAGLAVAGVAVVASVALFAGTAWSVTRKGSKRSRGVTSAGAASLGR